MTSKKYINLSGLNSFKTGYIIIGNTLFSIDKLNVDDWWELTSEKVEDKVVEARALAELDNRTRIVVDDEEIYDEDIVNDEGMLFTAYEAYERMSPEEQEDCESFIEHNM